VSSRHLPCHRLHWAAPVGCSQAGTSGCNCHQAARVGCRTQGRHLASLVHLHTLRCTRISIVLTNQEIQRHQPNTHASMSLPEVCLQNKLHHTADTQKRNDDGMLSTHDIMHIKYTANARHWR
jgi:hypothetical protein